MEMSETSSNLSYMTSSAFVPKRRGLDVITENIDQKDDEEESDSESLLSDYEPQNNDEDCILQRANTVLLRQNSNEFKSTKC